MTVKRGIKASEATEILASYRPRQHGPVCVFKTSPRSALVAELIAGGMDSISISRALRDRYPNEPALGVTTIRRHFIHKDCVCQR